MTTDHQQISVSAANYDLATPQLLQSAPFQLARQLIPALSGLELGIGGSLLMLELGLLTKARDLDLVCSQQDFPLIAAALGRLLTQVEVPPHPEYQSAAFARFIAAEGTEVDLMAGIKVKQQQLCWQFAPGRIEWRHQLPWMMAADWLELYQLFNRPERVLLLHTFLQQQQQQQQQTQR